MNPPANPVDARAPGAASALALPAFAAAIFLSASLLFVVEPMFAKMVLPRLGGSAGVWSAAMVFFQASLFLGYAYAHILTSRLPPRLAVLVHLAVLAGAALTLPLGIAAGFDRPPADGAALWVIGLFAASIGLPFFALSANAPLLQAWFARTAHRGAKDPYFLYAASNVGSFLALLSYPFLIEPHSTVSGQTHAWSLAFLVLVALVALCGALALFGRPTVSPVSVAPAAGDSPPAENTAPPGWRQAAVWTGLAAVPSGLLVALTAHLSTDVAAAPFLWVVPLALYLLTFVVVFQPRPLIPHRWMLRAEPPLIALLAIVVAMPLIATIFQVMAINLVAFFAIAMVCHGELSRRRPPARHLTSFYLWMSAGGMLGGLAAGLIAPNVFDSVLEYPILIVLAVLCRPGLRLPRSRTETIIWAAAIVAAAIAVAPAVLDDVRLKTETMKYVLGGVLAAGLLLSRWPLRLAGVVAFAFVIAKTYGADAQLVTSVRSFFGVIKVAETVDGQYRILYHGTTPHGVERLRGDDGKLLTGRPEPISYYHAEAPIVEAVKAVREQNEGPIHLGVIGLGTGTLACWARPEDKLDYFEIDRKMVEIATNPAYFTFLSGCAPPKANIILGDARLTLADQPDGGYDILIVDAFTSDAIPIHLLTTEAMALYKRKLAPGGLVVVHVSNRYMELASVVAGIGRANGLTARAIEAGNGWLVEEYKYPSNVVVLARNLGDFGPLTVARGWKPKNPRTDEAPWTDDYSNVFGAMLRQAHIGQ